MLVVWSLMRPVLVLYRNLVFSSGGSFAGFNLRWASEAMQGCCDAVRKQASGSP